MKPFLLSPLFIFENFYFDNLLTSKTFISFFTAGTLASTFFETIFKSKISAGLNTNSFIIFSRSDYQKFFLSFFYFSINPYLLWTKPTRTDLTDFIHRDKYEKNALRMNLEQSSKI